MPKGWCIIEWDGECTYDLVPIKHVFSVGERNQPNYTVDEKVLALCNGIKYRGKIASVAGKICLSSINAILYLHAMLIKLELPFHRRN